jgi:hypothetical protein
MAGNWNSRDMRMTKLRPRDNWYKGKPKVDPPERQIPGEDLTPNSFRRLESDQEGEEVSRAQAEENPERSRRIYYCRNDESPNSQSDNLTSDLPDGWDRDDSSRSMEPSKRNEDLNWSFSPAVLDTEQHTCYFVCMSHSCII